MVLLLRLVLRSRIRPHRRLVDNRKFAFSSLSTRRRAVLQANSRRRGTRSILTSTTTCKNHPGRFPARHCPLHYSLRPRKYRDAPAFACQYHSHLDTRSREPSRPSKCTERSGTRRFRGNHPDLNLLELRSRRICRMICSRIPFRADGSQDRMLSCKDPMEPSRRQIRILVGT
jgi:hypothetical protein